MPLTPQEKNFCDHLDYESTHAPYEEGVPVPARNWMTVHGVFQSEIENVLMFRRWERKDVMLTPKPYEPYAPAWKTAEEARRRNQELANEAKETDPTNPQALPRDGDEAPAGTSLRLLHPGGQERLREHEERNRRLAKQIVARATLARGVFVLDENLLGLESALREANIMVVTSLPGLSDDSMKKLWLFHRIVVTKNPTDFIYDAPVYEYGVIALDRLSFIDPAPEYTKNKTVQLISRAMSKYGLWTKGAKFLLELHDDEDHVLKELT